MRYFFPLFCSLIVSISPLISRSFPSLTAKSAILINAETGRVLYEKQGDLLSFPASTTKIATVLYALTLHPDNFEEEILVTKEPLFCVSRDEKRKENWGKYPAYVLQSDGSKASIKAGDIVTFKDLLYGVMLESGNDSSNVLAHFLGKGSIQNFMDGLNEYLQRLGCERTHFRNPHGLHHPRHATTARELARIAACAMKNPIFRQIVRTVEYEALHSGTPVRYAQHNKLLRKGPHHYEPAIGIKTGYTSMAAHTFVGAAKKSGRELIAVIFHTKTFAQALKEARLLFEHAFQERKVQKIFLPQGDQAFSSTFRWGEKPLTSYTKAPLILTYYPSEAPSIRCELFWHERILPIKTGEEVGSIRLVEGDKILSSVPLFAKEEVLEVWYAPLIRLAHKAWTVLFPYGFGAIFLVITAYLLYTRKKKRVKRFS